MPTLNYTIYEEDELCALLARGNRTSTEQLRLEYLHAKVFFGVELPTIYNSETYVVNVEPSNMGGTGPMVAHLANAKSGYIFVDEGGAVWVQGILHDIYPTEETAPKLITGMSDKARKRLGL